MRNCVVTRPRFETDFDRLFEDFFGGSNFFNSPQATVETDARRPRVNIHEDDKKVSLTFELPGMERDEIKVLVKERVLTVSAERKADIEESSEKLVHREIRLGSFSRSFTLPDSIDASTIVADYRNGLLMVSLDRKEEAKPKEIEVNVN